eukprot:1028095-Pleurochrysis_carterae.AAC.1
MMYKWGHPVAILPGDDGDKTSLSQNDVNSANHCAALTTNMITEKVMYQGTQIIEPGRIYINTYGILYAGYSD